MQRLESTALLPIRRGVCGCPRSGPGISRVIDDDENGLGLERLEAAECSQLLNIAALNGNSANAGEISTTPVNSGQQFFDQCKSDGISLLQCAQIANLAILSGNNLAIDLAGLQNILSGLGLSVTSLLNGLTTLLGGLVNMAPNTLVK
ncbi:hypothetical protein LTR86_006961 [Recurvomyces mirabilis]|nr:hypothetical protein LTR86_006961 [Recurvomyces mirabilis]